MALLSGVALTGLLFIGIVSLWVIYKLSQDIDDLSSVQIVALHSEMQADMMHDGLRAVVFRSILIAQANNQAEKQDCLDELNEFSGSFRKSLEELDKLPMDDVTKKSVKETFPEIGRAHV